MGEFDQAEFNSFVLDAGIIRFADDPFRLKSGRESHAYINWRIASGDVWTLEQTAQYVLAHTRDQGIEADLFMGVPEGATPLGQEVQKAYAKAQPGYGRGSAPLIMARGKVKSHGDTKSEVKARFNGGDPRKYRVVVLEDVTTTGGSLIDFLETLQRLEVTVVAAYGLTNRNVRRDDGRSVEEAVRDLGIPYHALSNAVDLFPTAYEQLQPPIEVARAVEQEWAQYGTRPLTLIEDDTTN